MLLAQVPQTARVNKKELKAPEVKYQGEPKFEKIEKTKVERAVNTDKSIIKVGDLYYMCFEGVWFMGKSPTGPWEVTGKVPGEIYEIPISSPAHNVTYVTVQDNDDEWATFATAAMYTGVMVAWGCAVWGSGWYYPPYYGGFYGGYRYYGHYPTYGYGASYNPWTGAYGRGAVAYGPYGGAGVGARYNPTTGTYSRGAAAYGPYGSRGRGPGLQPADGRLRPDAPGVERLRKLGQHAGAARRPVGVHVPGDQRPDRCHDARDARRAEAARRSPATGRGPETTPAWSRPAAATCTPAGTATSTASRTAAGSNTTTETGARWTSPQRDAAPVGQPRPDRSGGPDAIVHVARPLGVGRAAGARRRWTSSTATRGPAPRAPSAAATTAATAGAAAAGARTAAAAAAVAGRRARRRAAGVDRSGTDPRRPSLTR